ncbi:MAG: beta-propeller fold lactonase family protein [Candidatus Eremiobacteraeota bacterium]|nr:beta-propeller fold lactonase family protein [Candidatus Eremiobacteraeota bacterium]
MFPGDRAAVALGCVFAGALALAPSFALADADDGFLPTGFRITPRAAPGAVFARLATGLRADGTADAAEASATLLSPDGKTLLVLTSGYNLNFQTEAGADITHPVYDPTTGRPSASAKRVAKAEWVFVYDVSHGAPVEVQQIAIPNTYDGLAWRGDGRGFFVSGGIDDRVYEFDRERAAATFAPAPAFVLGHNSNDTQPVPKYDGGFAKPTLAARFIPDLLPTGAVVAGVAASADGRTLYAANLENDSLSVVDTATHRVADVAFGVPGAKTARGEFPYGVAVRSDASGHMAEAYVTSVRDGEVIGVAASGRLSEIPVGDGPNNLALSADAKTLYVVNGNSDTVSVIDTSSDAVSATIALSRPGDRYKGANPNGLALSLDGKRLYVTLGGENAVAIVDLVASRVLGRIPTGWYPTGVAVSHDGRGLYVINEKSNPGPDPANGYGTAAGKARNVTHQNQYGWAQEKAGLLYLPVPDAATLAALSAQVDANDGFRNRALVDPTMQFLHGKIKHVIFITNENRTYDQVLGDVKTANGDPALNPFPQPITPNHHAFATEFVTLDNFYDPAESSGVGWNWSVAGHANDYTERSQSVLYGNAEFKGLTYDYQGTNRNLDLGLPQTGGTTVFDERLTGFLDPSGSSSMLPGPKDVAASSGDGDVDSAATGGYIWDDALRHGLSVRDYGEHVDFTYYDPGSGPLRIPVSRTPFASHVPQAIQTKPDLMSRTDAYYRGFDETVPDVFRYEEWKREFDGYVKNGDLPSLEVMTVPHDHFGDFKTALDGLTTPALQFADNDYAVGKILETVSHSRYWNDTAIFMIEDDSQSGPDHVNTHRSTAFVLSPYTAHGSVDHTIYTTDSVLRTIESILGIDPLGIQDANALPMSTVFSLVPNARPYDAIVPGSLCVPPVAKDLVGAACTARNVRRTAALPELHDGAWWAAMTAGMDFSGPDRVDAAAFNAVLSYGMGVVAAR